MTWKLFLLDLDVYKVNNAKLYLTKVVKDALKELELILCKESFSDVFYGTKCFFVHKIVNYGRYNGSAEFNCNGTL